MKLPPALIAYWITTVLTAASYVAGGLGDLIQPADMLAEIGSLGYPLYFFSILGVWKLGAAVAILAPALPRLKEWAYAGICFNLTGAFASHLFVSDPFGKTITSVIVLAIAAASYVLRPASRKLPGPRL